MEDSISRSCVSRIVPGSHVTLTPEKRLVGPPGEETAGEPEIRLIREGDAIKAIEVTCTCGRHVRLNCVY
jgi:hypothetical protein